MSKELSPKQYLYAKFLLKRLGYTDEDIINDYLSRMEAVFGRWGNHTTNEGWTYSGFSVSMCVDILKQELEIKKNNNKTKLRNTDSFFLTGSSLSNFVFCPISYLISRSFETEKLVVNNSQEIGIKLHEQLRLVDKIIPYNFDENRAHRSSVFQNSTIKLIRSAELIFAGHKDEQRYFKNEEEKFIGQPDYIMKDGDGNFFVVEEKFQSISFDDDSNCKDQDIESSRNVFFENHKIQLIAYIKNIKEYKIKYGYLIYWYYRTESFSENGYSYSAFPQIRNVATKKVELDEFSINLYNTTRSKIKSIHQEGSFQFELSNVSIKKCVSCAVSHYCTFKTGRLNVASFPFISTDMKLYRADFPEELKKTVPEFKSAI